MLPEVVTFWMAGALPPVGAFFMNLCVRRWDALKSAGADWALILFSFDLTALIQLNDFAGKVQSDLFRANFSSLMAGCLIASLVIWLASINVVEPALKAVGSGPMFFIKKLGFFVLGWGLVITLFAMHAFIFIQRNPSHG